MRELAGRRLRLKCIAALEKDSEEISIETAEGEAEEEEGYGDEFLVSRRKRRRPVPQRTERLAALLRAPT